MADVGKLNQSEWLQALAAGDESALAHFFKLYQKSLGYFAVRMIGDKYEAEDIVANCFVKLWNLREAFASPEKLKSFLYVSCRNLCLNYLRNLKVRNNLHQSYSDELERSEKDVLYKILESEVLQALHSEIDRLPMNYKEVFCRIYFEQRRTDDIARELGLSIQTVRNYKARAVELLRSEMLKKGLSGVFTLAMVFLHLRNV